MHLAFDICQGIGLAAAVGIRPFLPALAAGALAAGDVELDFKHTQYAFLQRPAFLLALVIGTIVLTFAERRLHPRPAGPAAAKVSGSGAKGAGKASGSGAKAGGKASGSGAKAAGKAGGSGTKAGGKVEATTGGKADATKGGGLERGPLAVIIVLASVGIAAVLFAGELCRGGADAWPGYVAGPVCALIAAAASRPLFARVRARLDAAAAAALPLYAEGVAILLAVLSVLAFPVGPIGLLFLIWLLIAGRRRGEQKYAGLRILR